MTLSLRLRRSGGRTGGPGGGAYAAAGGSADGGAGGGADVMAQTLLAAGDAVHQGTPPSDPGPQTRVVPGVGAGCGGATISTVTTTLPVPARPPLVRPHSGRLLAGVAAGTAVHLRADPLVVRVAFVVLAAAGIGVVAYALLWFFMPVAIGLTVIWRQLDTDRALTRPGLPWLLAGGVALGVAGVVLLLATTGQLANAR